jgi:hypothetical protein
MTEEGDPGWFTVWAMRDGARKLYSVCRTNEEVRSAKDAYEAAGYEVVIVEKIAATAAERMSRPH